MSDERKKARVCLWIVVLLIVLPALYVLSAGPVTVLVIMVGEPEPVSVAYGIFYTPLWSLRDSLPESLQALYYDYSGWWLGLAANLHEWFND